MGSSKLGAEAWVDVDISNSTFTNTGFVGLINGIATGSASYNRQGNVITPVYIQLMGSVATASSSSSPGPFFRMAIVYDNAPNGVLPAYSDIFSGYAKDGTSFSNGQIGINPSYINRFELVKDFLVQLGFITSSGNTLISTSPAQKDFNRFIRTISRKSGNYFPVNYKVASNTTDIKSISTGAFYYVFYSSSADAGQLAVTGTIRFGFKP